MWQDFDITEEDIEMYGDLIPEYCIKPLKNGDIMGLAVINTDSEANPLVGIVLYRYTDGYVEIEWVSKTDAYTLPDHGADMVRLVKNKARIKGRYRGIIGRFRKGDVMDDYFPEYEFRRNTEQGRAYSFRLSDVENLTEKENKEGFDNCVPLCRATENEKHNILSRIGKEEQPVPLSSSVNWADYEQDISALYIDGKQAEGIVLGREAGDALEISLLYSVKPAAAIVLLSYAFNTALKKYGKDQEIICPVLTKESEKLLKKLVVDPESEEVVTAQADFPMGTGMLKDFQVYCDQEV